MRRAAEADLRGVAGELLPERDRHGVHQVRAAGLDDVLELLRLAGERRLEPLERGQQRVSVASSSAARCTALGNTSLDDWPMLTWSFGCAPSPARFAMTSLAFMFDDVPEPVWKTSIGNWSSCSPSAISSAAAAIRCARSPSSSPELGVGARGRALDAAEPAHHRDRDALARHGEVVDRLAGLAAPQLLSRLKSHALNASAAGLPSVRLGSGGGGDLRARTGLRRDVVRVQRPPQ